MPVYIVSGVHRSGTTMMMGALNASGIPALYSREQDDFQNGRFAEIHGKEYNPGSFYEHGNQQPGFPHAAQGMCVKMFVMDLPAVPGILPTILAHPEQEFEVLMLWRKPEVAVESLKNLIGPWWQGGTEGRIELMKRAWVNYLNHARDGFLPHVTTHVLEYDNIVEDPREQLKLLPWPFDIDQAVEFIKTRQTVRVPNV